MCLSTRHYCHGLLMPILLGCQNLEAIPSSPTKSLSIKHFTVYLPELEGLAERSQQAKRGFMDEKEGKCSN